MPKRDLYILGGILLVGVLLRAFYLAELARSPHFEQPLVDAGFHDYWARGLVTGQWQPPGSNEDPLIRAHPYLRPPGYPYFLAFVYWLSGCSHTAARVVQMLIGLLSAALGYLLGRAWFGRSEGLVFAGLLATHWILIYFEGELLAPVLLVSLGLAALLSLGYWRRSLRALPALGAGCLIGLFALVRPNVLIFGGMALLWVYWVCRRRQQPKRFPRAAAAALLGMVLTILPATLRNYLVAKDWVLISANAGINLYIGNNPTADGLVAQELPGLGKFETCYDYPALVRTLEREQNRRLKYSEVSALFARKAWRFVREAPGRALALTGKRALLFWGPADVPHNKEIYHECRSSAVLNALSFAPGWALLWSRHFRPGTFPLVLSLAVLGLGLLYTDRRREPPAHETPGGRLEMIVLILVFVGAYSVSYLPFFVAARYRVPIIPFLLLFSACAICGIVRLIRARRARQAVVWLAGWLVLFGLTCVDWAYGYPPATDQWFFLRGRAYDRQGKVREAIQDYSAALSVNPGFTPAHGNLANIYLRQGLVRQAIAHCVEALRLKPDDVVARHNLADALAAEGEIDDAAAQYREILARDPLDWRTCNALGILMAKHKRFDEALAAFSQALAAGGESSGTRANMGIACARRGDYAAAARHFSLALRLAPGDPKLEQFLQQAREAAANQNR
ncbi:MAG: tetratricopeptide repeat protein [Kiritimatiellae bacterium]|nr:tetratricopeptide repeat protein [Kiritimatiellia bacterium]